MDSDSNILDRLEAVVDRLEKTKCVEPEFVTVTRAALVIGIGVKALRGAVQSGDVRVYHLGTSGGRPRVHVAEVRAWAFDTAFDPFEKARLAGNVAARTKLKETE